MDQFFWGSFPLGTISSGPGSGDQLFWDQFCGPVLLWTKCLTDQYYKGSVLSHSFWGSVFFWNLKERIRFFILWKCSFLLWLWNLQDSTFRSLAFLLSAVHHVTFSVVFAITEIPVFLDSYFISAQDVSWEKSQEHNYYVKQTLSSVGAKLFQNQANLCFCLLLIQTSETFVMIWKRDNIYSCTFHKLYTWSYMTVLSISCKIKPSWQ